MSDDQKNEPKNGRKNQSVLPYVIVIAVLAILLGVCVYKLFQGDEPGASGDASTSLSQTDKTAKTDVVDVDKVNRAASGEDAAGSATTPEGGATAEPGQEADPEVQGDGDNKIDPDSVVGKIGSTLQKYYAATSPEEKLKYVIDPERVEPLMRDLYFRSPLRATELTNMSLPQSLPFQGVVFWRVETHFRDGAKGIAAIRLIDGEPKIDWESEVRYCSMDWEKWADSEEALEGDFRVYAILDQYYPKPFDDQAKYVCIKLRRHDSSISVFAYLDLNDVEQRPLIELIARGQLQECTLRLKRVPADTPSPLASVVKVLSTSWIVVNPDGGEAGNKE